MIVGAAAGALSGKFTDYGINDDFIKDLRDKVTEGTSALFLLTGQVTVDKVREAFAPDELGDSTTVPAAGPRAIAQASTSPTGSGAACVALQEVTTGQTEVRKRIENRPFGNNNWHIDWLVSNQPTFSYFPLP